jgi:hypothetical protein
MRLDEYAARDGLALAELIGKREVTPRELARGLRADQDFARLGRRAEQRFEELRQLGDFFEEFSRPQRPR